MFSAEARGANAVRAGHVVMGRYHSTEGRDRNGIFRNSVTEEVDGIAFAERLAATVDGAQRDRQAATGGEDRSDGPSAQQVPYEARLRLVPRAVDRR